MATYREVKDLLSSGVTRVRVSGMTRVGVRVRVRGTLQGKRYG